MTNIFPFNFCLHSAVTPAPQVTLHQGALKEYWPLNPRQCIIKIHMIHKDIINVAKDAAKLFLFMLAMYAHFLFTCPLLRTDTRYYVQSVEQNGYEIGVRDSWFWIIGHLENTWCCTSYLSIPSICFLLNNKNMIAYILGSFWRLLTVLLRYKSCLTYSNHQ